MRLKPPGRCYILGIGGIAMANLACLLKDLGFEVAGSDKGVYPPARDLLEEKGIPYRVGYDAGKVASQTGKTDFFVVGNAVSYGNQELEALLLANAPVFSLPEVLRMFLIQDKRAVVVAGTHGKTTTSSAIAWSLYDTGVDPSYFIGGIPRNTKQGYRIGQGPFCVLEGDEYDTACFDKHPKAFHYAPFGLVLTHVEFDHADIYRDLGHVRDAFRFLAGLVPPEGFLLASSEIQGLHGLLEGFRGRMYTFGDYQNDEFSIRDFRHTGDGAYFRIVCGLLGQEVPIETPLRGMFNARNLTAAFGVSLLLGAEVQSAAQSLQAFHGVRRRVEILAETGHASVIEDFAHHPTAVRAVLTAIRDSYPNRELRVIFEPRSNTMRRRVLQEALIDALCLADAVFLRPPDRLDTVPEDERIDPQEVVQTLQSRGVKACIEPDTDRLVEKTLTLLGSPFVLVLLSNADTQAFKERILEAFAREKA